MRVGWRCDEQVDVIPLVDFSKRTLACNVRVSTCAREYVGTVGGGGARTNPVLLHIQLLWVLTVGLLCESLSDLQ